jgi:hypothetical protein
MFVIVFYVLLDSIIKGENFILAASTALLSVIFMAQHSDPYASIGTAVTLYNFNIVSFFWFSFLMFFLLYYMHVGICISFTLNHYYKRRTYHILDNSEFESVLWFCFLVLFYRTHYCSILGLVYSSKYTLS